MVSGVAAHRRPSQPSSVAGGEASVRATCFSSFHVPLKNGSWSRPPLPQQPPGRAPGHIFAISWALTGLFERKN